mmetsp:Transcript_35604/g.42880  ORF Transcript_35604/g.42880 Transcript_35604/m.42880 type:complete len:189 (+) Transcript_35604:202-768(+)|eukprot:CAMPEP_0197844826 /NCGR_PEP_ID=MMETSP1438-20131217/1801_1 /TAXON_ID=1461541 /ORGANISM="Pterosperma sp., Strain CCMP1384" /LENGTH=188 /DNA_ID=CAMNT_0043455815 /DNA_START=200 /DNA_END=766 /DNA_ORIENTATION=-
MAKQGAKKLIESNKKHLQKLQIAIAVSLGLYAVIRLHLFKASTSWWHYFGFFCSSGTALFFYWLLSLMAKATYGSQGEVLDGGLDLTVSTGFATYYHDLIYITIFVQVMSSLVSDWFWLVYSVVPMFCIFRLWTDVISPYIFTPQPGEDGYGDGVPENETKAERKKREKMERKAEMKENRPKMMKMRQ